MICYTSIETPDHGFLMFKVIGAKSQEHAQAFTSQNWGKRLIAGETIEKESLTICPLYSELKSFDGTTQGRTKINELKQN